MTNNDLVMVSNYFVKKYFDNIPKIKTKFAKVVNCKDIIGTFIVSYRHANDISCAMDSYGLDEIDEESDLMHKMQIIIDESIRNSKRLVIGTLLHELSHYYCYYLGLEFEDNSVEFERFLKERGYPSKQDFRFSKISNKWISNYDYSQLTPYIKEAEQLIKEKR